MSMHGAQMLDDGIIHVGMGEVKVARHGEVLSALLGSCVAIAVLWPKGGKCALAHCLLPQAPSSVLRFGARFVDQAMPSLLALLGASDDHKRELTLVLAGGASMLGRAGLANPVGRLNIVAARSAALQHGVTVSYEDLGGRLGRHISIDSAAYAFDIKKVERHFEEFANADASFANH